VAIEKAFVYFGLLFYFLKIIKKYTKSGIMLVGGIRAERKRERETERKGRR